MRITQVFIASLCWLAQEPTLAPPPLKPPPIAKGEVIGLVAPASPLAQKQIQAAAEQIRRRGFRVKIADEGSRQRGYLSGVDEARAEAFNSLIRDPEVRAIFCLRGGYGSPRILDKIDYAALRQSPKAIVGYSDITAILLSVQARAGVVTFHGPMGKEWSTARGITPFSEKYFWDLLMGSESKLFLNWGGERANGMKTPVTIVKGQAEGRLTGGNLSVVCSTLGTPFEIETQGRILFLEEVGEKVFRIDRLLNQLRLAGKLREIRGVLLGMFPGCEGHDPEGDLTLGEVFNDYLEPLGVPVLADFPSGHVPDQVMLPFGVLVRLDATTRTLSILEPAVAPMASKLKPGDGTIPPPLEEQRQ